MTTTDTPTFIISGAMALEAGFEYEINYYYLKALIHLELASEFERLEINYKDVTLLTIIEISAKTKSHTKEELGSCQAFLCKLYLSWLATKGSNDSDLQEFIGIYDRLCVKIMSSLDDSVDHLNSNTYKIVAEEIKYYKDFGNFVHSTSYALRQFGGDPRELTMLFKSSEDAENSFRAFGLDAIGTVKNNSPVEIDYSDYKIMKLLGRR